MRSHISTASSILCVTIRIARDRHAAFAPQIEKVGAQRFGGQHVERGERLVHQQHLWMHHQRTRKADALAHAAGKLLRVGGFEAVEADEIDRGQRALVPRLRGEALRLQPELTFSRTVSQGNSAKVWNTMATCRCRTRDRLVRDGDDRRRSATSGRR